MVAVSTIVHTPAGQVVLVRTIEPGAPEGSGERDRHAGGASDRGYANAPDPVVTIVYTVSGRLQNVKSGPETIKAPPFVP